MQHRIPNGRDFREIIEDALEGQAGVAATEDADASGCIVGEVLDTHHPHLPGRVSVRFLNGAGKVVELWVQAERHLTLRKADRVLLTLPRGWKQWVVTGALGREAPAALAEEVAEESSSELRLGPGQGVRVLAHDGTPLVTVRQGVDGPELQLGSGNVELKAARTLRLSADTIELQARSGGVELRTEGDTVVRARTIRLN